MVRESNPETTDPRVQRTKQQLRRALVELLKTANTKEISIQAITKQAQITRGTFYLHYEDKTDFIQKAVQDLIRDLYQTVTIQNDKMAQPYQQINLLALFEYVERRQDAFKVFHKNDTSLAFKQQLTTEMRRLIEAYLNNLFQEATQSDQIELSITADYLAGASLVLVFKWIEDGLVYSPRYMAKMLYQLVQMPNMAFNVAGFFVEA
ncbi:MAG: TetR/AcrR family transcriptional regulator [Latilactobacillus sakei]|uniref:TetR/AcrR family transcriptional regulator n=1 Tax=Latilactobacillus sakei TaxID=1599 RepID=UPI000340A432|nr:TetR/AcrR family transcriptional regulator [Latilactobacillus sakei]EOR85288.1 transcriptional regulator, TetR family [Latilactobacillus sakei subsp. sakei LS25]PKX63455.1 TetR family transcriptional regulator [Latilactobacillus sakei]PKX67474.1 TetR family transcriptional regulator [Latilactobacillus sakei]